MFPQFGLPQYRSVCSRFQRFLPLLYVLPSHSACSWCVPQPPVLVQKARTNRQRSKSLHILKRIEVPGSIPGPTSFSEK
jgi:hypothetical protein